MTNIPNQTEGNNIDFVVGDTVVFIDSDMHDCLMTVSSVGMDCVLMDDGAKFALTLLLRHASITEIKAKRRLPQSNLNNCIGDDQFIENHISPNCKTISNDEQIYLSKALAAQKEVS